MSNFTDKKQYKKGKIGEEEVKKWLKELKYIVFPTENDCPHDLDGFAMKKEGEVRLVEVKTYPRRLYYPDTGMNYNHYKICKEFDKDVYMFFVDELEKKVYGNKLSILDQKCSYNYKDYPSVEVVKSGPKKGEEKIYFPLGKMEFYFFLSEDKSKEIKKLYSGNYKNGKFIENFEINWLKNESWK